MGNVATASLQRLDDGQNDDRAQLRRKLAAEAREAATATGRPEWDGSTWMSVPSALKGLKPVTPEPWAKDSDAYAKGMPKHGAVIRTHTRPTPLL